jgi:glucose-6-phosphate 1-dehydrogenase
MSSPIRNGSIDQPPADALVMFGVTGDLASRKLFPALYQLERAGRLDLPVIGVARRRWTVDTFRAQARDAVERSGTEIDAEVLERMLARLELVRGEYSDPEMWHSLRDRLEHHGSTEAVFYMAIPPAIFPEVAESLASVNLHRCGRIVVEKPFGRDQASAHELNDILHSVFPEEKIFRIDHYLGKEAVESLLVFRFANSLLEPVWNRRYVRSVQVTMSETIGVEGRGSFYEEIGAIRDVFQNHLLQVVSLLAMEPPVGPTAQMLHDEQAKVCAAMRPISTDCLVQGQYHGYLEEPGVDPASVTETFAATRLEIDSWRWAGVPWFVRVGKGLAETATEAVVEFHSPPPLLFDAQGCPPPERNLIRLRLGARDGVTMSLSTKAPGATLHSQTIDLSVDFDSALGERKQAYERLLGDAIDGSARRFARQDMVEQTWRVVQPALDHPGEVHAYERGSWGPEAAMKVLAPGDHWFKPTS